MKSFIILNPSSSQGKALKLKEELEQNLKKYSIEYHIHISKNNNDVENSIRANFDNFDNFVSFGGDGTLHIIANTLAKTNKSVASIPVGSGNDIAKNLGIPLDISNACRVIKENKIIKIDLGLINKKYYFLGVSGAGFDSVVTELANNTKFPIKGPAKYTYAVYKTLITYRAKKFFIRFDDIKEGKKELVLDAMFCVAGNMKMYGGGMKITPLSDYQDGILDICIIKKMSKFHFIKTFPSVFEGKHLGDPYVDYYKVKSLFIDSEYNFSVFADGEYICKLPAHYEVASKAINFIVP